MVYRYFNIRLLAISLILTCFTINQSKAFELRSNRRDSENSEEYVYKSGDLADYLESNHGSFPSKFKSIELSETDINFLINNDPSDLKEISWRNKLTDKQVKSILRYWRSRNFNDIEKYSLYGILKKFNKITPDILVPIVKSDPGSYLFIYDYYIKDDLEANKKLNDEIDRAFMNFLSSALDQYNQKTGKISDGKSVLVWANRHRAETIALLGKHIPKFNRSSVLKPRIKDLGVELVINEILMSLSLTSEEYRKIYQVNADNLCSTINKANLRGMNLTKDEFKKCFSKNVNKALLKYFIHHSTAEAIEELLPIILPNNYEVITLLPSYYYDNRNIIKILDKYKDNFKTIILKKHLALSQEKGKRHRPSGEVPPCSQLIPKMFKDDKDVVMSALYISPMCSYRISLSYYNDKDFKEHYIKAWKGFREKIGSQNSRRRGSASKGVSQYVEGLSRLQMSIRGNESIRLTPLYGLTADLFKDKKFITEILKVFPEDYYNIPPHLRPDYEIFKEGAGETGFDNFLKRMM